MVFLNFRVFQGSPLNRLNLRAVNIDQCAACVIMSARKSHSEDNALADKEVILCSLNIKAMKFGGKVPRTSAFASGS